MITEKTIKIQGKDVTLRYCAAAETGFEQLRPGRTCDVFVKHGDADVAATTEDYIALALAAIIAAYARRGEESPVSSDTILYDCTPGEVQELLLAVMELRNKWYLMPEQVKEPSAGEDVPKN